ncbi:MAG: hypothetical protein HS111_04395 [Kofleriaceae bacterium]|nr:hypothetical protein [Kofleriaceae bacterium]MCL4224576.1 hypothetical protein [Myxococcales bacterium]
MVRPTTSGTHSLALALAIAVLAPAAACGGKGGGTTTTPAGGGTSGGGTSSADDALRAELAAMAVPEACSGTEATTLRQLLTIQRGYLGTDAETEETFTCRERGDGEPGKSCEWSVFGKPSGAADPDDPCGGECCSGYQILFEVDAAGAVVADSIHCIAPG